MAKGDGMWMAILKSIITAVAVSSGKDMAKATPELWKNVKDWWQGKCIAVIGPTASGKNTMFSKLAKLPPAAEYTQTRGAENVGKFDFSWPLPNKTDIKFTCKRSINVGGELDERERFWAQSCKGADVIFYLIDFEKLVAAPDITLARIKDDLKWMLSNFNEFKSSSVVHILLNKIDIVHGDDLNEEDEATFYREVEEKIKYIQALAEKHLAGYFKRVTGITPISMVNNYLFKRYFTASLEQVFSRESGK